MESIKKLDQNLIDEAYKNGGFLLVLNVPKGTTIGLDWFEFQTDKNFMGFKMVPTDLSPHFLYANANDTKNAGEGGEGVEGGPVSSSPIGSRVGYFFKLTRPGEITAVTWDHENEVLKLHLGELPNSQQLKDIDNKLAPFPYKTGMKWKSLTSNIILRSIEDEEIFNPFEYQPYYSELPKYWFDLKNATAMEKYLYKDDSSWLFSDEKQHDSKFSLEKCLSDFELHFIYFVIGQDFTAFENWKDLLKILAHFKDGYQNELDASKKINPKTLAIMSKFIRSLIIQLVEFPTDMLDVAKEDNLLYHYLSKIIISSREHLPDRSKRLEKFINEQFGWDVKNFVDSFRENVGTIEIDPLTDKGRMVFDDSVPEDERPVVVDLM